MSLMWALAVCPISALLLFTCVSVEGVVFASGALLLGMAPGLACFDPERIWVRRSAVIAFALSGMATVWLVWRAPDGHARAGARVSNRYVGGGWHYQSKALGALLPEVDQFMLGFKLVPVLDSLFTMQQSRKLSALTRTIYAELESDVDFRALGSVMPDVYDNLLGLRFDRGHYFLYVPVALDKSAPVPALIFLHGSGGNFKAYTWLLSQVADQLHMALIAPSYGMGNWDGDHGVRAVMAALDDAAKIVPLDMANVHLAGLSNGGLGVSRIAADKAGRRFRSLIFLSPVCDGTAISSPSFAEQWKNRPVLVISGREDDRVPISYVETCAATMSAAGAAVEMKSFDGADHFLIFSHRNDVLSDLGAWLKENMVDKQARDAP